MKSKITAYSRKDGVVSLMLDGDISQTAKKGETVHVRGLGQVDGNYTIWNTAPPNVIQFSQAGKPDVPETTVEADAHVEMEQSKTHSAR